MNRARGITAALTLVGLAFSGACSTGGRLVLRSTPHDEYAAMLRRAGLDKTTLGRQWQAASDLALRAAAPIASPFAETGYFPADEPMAVAYRLQLPRGRRLAIEVRFETSLPGRLFVDLFRVDGDELRPVGSLGEAEPVLEYDVDRTAAYVLRLQPELLRSGRFVLTERTLAMLRTFPVIGITHRAVQSGFGAARDAGTRAHEGIDIFASRGTPVVAVAGGFARTDTNGLGGNVVWLRTGLLGGTTYYYAHLDRWEIGGSARVEEGDVLGYVGNTGNARSTSPHLHFGVYDGDAIDPAPFLQPDEPPPAPGDAGNGLGLLLRTRAARTPLREGPSAASAQRLLLEADTLVRRLGVAAGAHRVSLPDGSTGYMAATALVSADTPLRRTSAAGAVALRERPRDDAPVVMTLEPGVPRNVFGRFNAFDFIRVTNGAEGWATR
jgi:peptidoglycan LD-endopeptidase LytH